MGSQLVEAVVRRDREGVDRALSILANTGSWSLITVIDELIPLALMESHLRYGNFHLIKMSLFLRRLAMEGFFSTDTERGVGRVVALEAVSRDWVSVQADRRGYAGGATPLLMNSMLTELDEGNVHNAFHYALGLLEEPPEPLMQALLTLGAVAIPHSLGHTLSCFFPVMEDIVAVDHPATASAVLSYLMYLGRYGVDKRVLQEGYGQSEDPLDCAGFLRVCASGDGIVNLHHMITLYVATAWERATFNPDGAVPYALLQDWVGQKPLDRERYRRAASLELAGSLPDTYEAFSQRYSLREPDELLSCLFRMLDEMPRQAVDWLFRFYASHYAYGRWDPHYYTGLYAALRLYMGERIHDQVARRMALDQAVRYFAQGMGA
jgi:hypothetical protein